MTSQNTAHFWLASKPADVQPSKLGDYLNTETWSAPNPAGARYELDTMRPGDRIALKSTTRRKTGLPFFSDDRTASVMPVYATGTVERVDAANGTVTVRWEPAAEPRDWYFLTYMKPLVRVEASDAMREQLFDFVFNRADQDLALFLADPFWGDRYTMMPQFTWIPIYEAIATRLVDFRDNRTALVEIVRSLTESHPLLNYIATDQFETGPGPLKDVDPFTVMATFNRGVTTENRRAIVASLSEALDLDVSAPDDFDGVPIMNNQKSWFVSYAVHRGHNDIRDLWDTFEAGLALAADDSAENRQRFCEAYDAAQQVRGVKWNLSQGLYWARPNAFVTLDGPSRRYLAETYRLEDPNDGAAYLHVRDALLDTFETTRGIVTSFPLLSYAAWVRALEKEPGHDMRGFATWAGRMAESMDLDEVENGYKRKTAALLQTAREQSLAGDQRWGDTFHEALRSTNTLDFRFIDDLRQAVQTNPGAVLAALNIVWESPSPEVLDEFQVSLGAVLSKLTPGNATGLGAWLLMSMDPENNAPYSPTRTTKWYHLSDFRAPGTTGSATVRYNTMIAFLDELQETVRHQLHAEYSRLETQGLAWATSENDIPKAWAKEEQQALKSWRANSQSGQRAWLVRPKNVSAQDWIDLSYVSLPATKLPDVRPGSSEKVVKEAVDSGYQHVDYTQRQSLTAEYYFFLSVMKLGDLVAAQSDTSLHIGTVESDPDYVGAPDDRLHREVNWLYTVETDTVPATLKGLLDLQGSVVDITQGVDELNELLAPEPSVVRSSAQEPTFPSVTDEFAGGLHVDTAFLQEVVDLLASRKQIVFYGPPGTGKTYLALALARYLVGPEDRSRVQLVQFHPSYAYEDFFEGFRPAETKHGEATFELRPGPLRLIAKDAVQNPEKPYILVIDELNRANLAKVFGELYFLLEYRKETIQLQYNSAETFQLPPNLYFIGTMNTADRSIALLDAAMRRRFSFVELHPDEPPVRDLLSRWLDGQDDERARLLSALNAAIDDQDRDLRIGPSYLMRPEASTADGLSRIWKYDIMPLLEEHYYARMSRKEILDKFGLEAIRKAAAGGADQEVPDQAPDDFLDGLNAEDERL